MWRVLRRRPILPSTKPVPFFPSWPHLNRITRRMLSKSSAPALSEQFSYVGLPKMNVLTHFVSFLLLLFILELASTPPPFSLFIFISLYFSFYLPLPFYLYLSISFFISLSLLSLFISLHLVIFLFISRSLSLFISFSLSLYLSLYLFISLSLFITLSLF